MTDADDLGRFAGQVLSGFDGEAARQATIEALRAGDVAGLDAVLRSDLAAALKDANQGSGRLATVAAVLDREDLELEATNDVFWDAVVSIEPDGVEEVFDATVVGNHNFIADGIAVHNSIEQDADMVLLLHREDAYEKESPRAGEADFIVAKHRNGPTATITVAFQGHYSRFVDMSPS